MAKIEYLILPKGTKFTGSGTLHWRVKISAKILVVQCARTKDELKHNTNVVKSQVGIHTYVKENVSITNAIEN